MTKTIVKQIIFLLIITPQINLFLNLNFLKAILWMYPVFLGSHKEYRKEGILLQAITIIFKEGRCILMFLMFRNNNCKVNSKRFRMSNQKRKAIMTNWLYVLIQGISKCIGKPLLCVLPHFGSEEENKLEENDRLAFLSYFFFLST